MTEGNQTNSDAKAMEIKARYTGHRLDREAVDKMRTIRRHVRELATAIQMLCPDGRSKATAFTHLDAVMTTANAAIAQTFPVDETDV